MHVPFDQLPDSARIWVYQADRDLTTAEAETVESHLRAFSESWVAHGQPLRTSFTLLNNRFVVLAADEAAGTPSGCSIDSSVNALRALENQLGVGFLDKSRVPYQQPDGATGTLSRAALREAVTAGTLNPATPVFDTLVPTVGALRTGWVKPATETWLLRYFSLEKNGR